MASSAPAIGTPTAEYVSGTVEEIKKHVAAGKTAKIYFSDVPVAPSTVDAEQYALVRKFREECQSTGLYATFDSIERFRNDFSHHLDLEMNQPRYRWLPAPEAVSADRDDDFSSDALRLLIAAATDDGEIILQDEMDSYGLRAGSEEFLDGTARSRAMWKARLEELARANAVEYVSDGIYHLTARGYELAERVQTGNTQQTVRPFEEQQQSHVHSLIDPLRYMQRDLLRFLLLQGGAARVSVVLRAATNQQVPIDMNELTNLLIVSGLISRTDDNMLGHSTLTVNESIATALKALLFPRKEQNDTPFFKGI